MHRSLPIVFAFLSAMAVGCSGGGGGNASSTGSVSVVLTDAANEDLEAFEVDVGGMVFTKLDLSTVSVLPRSTRVDFTQLQALSEMVAGASIPAGIYRSIALTLDFSTAVVSIKGQTTPAAVVDVNGAPITGMVDVRVDFASGARPIVALSRHHLFALDLDLDQGVTVDSGLNTVTFCPVLSVEVDPSNPRPVATAGVLTAVDTTASTFTVERRATDDSAIAQFVVETATTTVFQIDGVNLVGDQGLAALAAQLNGRVYVQGILDADAPILHAVAVEAGAGVPGGTQDWVIGHIVGRDNGTGSNAALTVLGRSRAGSTSNYNTLHTVNVTFAATKVLRRGAANSLTTDALDVGQLVWAFGTLSGTTLDATATTGVVRMLRTSIFGVATGAPASNTLTLNVARFDLRDISAFAFTVNSATEADPANFTVDVTGLDTTGVTTGSRIRVLGFVNPVGVTTDRNAAAISLVNHSTQAKVLFCQWSPASATAIDSITSSAITLDVSAALLHTVADGFSPVTINTAPAPSIVPLGALGIYRIVQAGAVEVNLGFIPFSLSLQTRAASSNVFRVAAFGTYDESTQVFSASVITVVLQ